MKKKIFTPTLTQSDINCLIDSMKIVFPTREETITKLDDVSTKLDKFVGEIESSRKTQELQAKNLSDVDDRFEKIEKHLGIKSSSL